MADWKISLESYRDKVYGCFMGKNIGGTLGAPFEGTTEVMNLDFYPEVREGGIPNDDLEMQLVWLKCLQEVGPGLTARDLSEYWLNCIIYNYDEYGFAKLNLRRGLVPPVSGTYNNWFAESMGCPIRSEIWACVAPGAPDVAAEMAFEDAIVDHARESVWAEMFLAAVESAAFVIPDRDQLIKIGLAHIPPKSRIAEAVRNTIRWQSETGDWKATRLRILENYGHSNCTDVTQNIAIAMLGWVAGRDFGDAICIAVNCGCDTDCTGATLGAILGILHGRSGLPAKWTEPLGENIVISPGILHLQPQADLAELTEQIVEQGRKVLAYHNRKVEFVESGASTAPANIPSAERSMPLWATRWDAVQFKRPGLNVEVDYHGFPTAAVGKPKIVGVRLRNMNPEPVEAQLDLYGPPGFCFEPDREWVPLDPGEEAEWEVAVEFGDPHEIGLSNLFIAVPRLRERPAVEPVSFMLLPEYKWEACGPYPNEDGAGFDTPYPPELGEEVEWRELSFPEFGMEVEPLFGGKPGILYLKYTIHSPEPRRVHVVGYNTQGIKVFLNGELVHNPEYRVPIRPSFGGWPYGAPTVELREGVNTFLLKVERLSEPIDQVHLAISTPDLDAGLSDIWS